MLPIKAALSGRRGKFLFIALLVATTQMTACASSMPRLPTGPNPLVIANCPENLGKLDDPSFGATAEKLVQVAGIYYKCRTAAMTEG